MQGQKKYLWKGNVYNFSVDYDAIDKSERLNIHKYLMLRNILNIIMPRLIKQAFLVLLSFNGSLATKCVSLNNKPCITRPVLINLNSLELNYYLFMISLVKCNEICNVADDLPTKIYVSSKKRRKCKSICYDNKNIWSQKIGKKYFIWL